MGAAAGLAAGPIAGIFDGVSSLLALQSAEQEVQRQQEELQRRDDENVEAFRQRTRLRGARVRSDTGRVETSAAFAGVTGQSIAQMAQTAAERSAITAEADVTALGAERRSNVDARIQLVRNLRTARIQTGISVATSIFDTVTKSAEGISALEARNDANLKVEQIRLKQMERNLLTSTFGGQNADIPIEDITREVFGE